jgi:tetratricopeptide (TPR) repeat protein
LGALTGLVSARGDLAQARRLLGKSASWFEDAGDERGKAAMLVRRAYLELAEGDLAAARVTLEEALELRRGQGDRRGLRLVLVGLGLIDTIAGEYASAEEHLAETREMFRRAGDRWGLASSLWRTADLAFARDRLDDAEAALQEARVVLGATGRQRWIANTIAGLAEVALLRDDPQQAGALFAEARDRYAARGDALGVADVEERLRGLAKEGLRPRKEAAATTARSSNTKNVTERDVAGDLEEGLQRVLEHHPQPRPVVGPARPDLRKIDWRDDPRGREPAARPRHAAWVRAQRRAAFVCRALALLDAPDRPPRGTTALRRGADRRAGAHGPSGEGAAQGRGDRFPRW